MEAFRIFVDPNILRSAEGLRITLMQKSVSFLKTEASRDREGAAAALDTVSAIMLDPTTGRWKEHGKVICHQILNQPAVEPDLDAYGNPIEGSTGLTNLVEWVVNISF